ncbi:uncharacterized protein LOC127847797 isoform X2 [Dreissena polymorpha]|uniref:uncharacterized protein LOC127847797 isoform X2 n=1 Tax=Dreissena polymorpha TaxID=45954 RepID=UPI00226527EB|nr:uncharacterized protein LOC127847797 isoform X2 [Dreissena polymorpha]
MDDLEIGGWRVNDASILSQSLASLQSLETLSINVEAITSDFWSALYSLKIKRVALSLYIGLKGLIVSHVGMLSQPSFSISQIDSNYIDVNSKPDLLKALHGLIITSLCLCGIVENLDLNQLSLLVTLLTSLKQLERLSIDAKNDSLCLWFAMNFFNIKILDIGIRCQGFTISRPASLSTLLPSLKQIDKIRWFVTDDISVLLEVLNGLNIKSLRWDETHAVWTYSVMKLLRIDLQYYSSGLLEAHNSLNVRSLCLRLYGDDSTKLTMTQKSSLYHSLSSHTELETLIIDIPIENSTGLWEALRCLNVKTRDLKGNGIWFDMMNDAHSVSQSLLLLTQLETLGIEVFSDRPGLWEALRCLNVKTLHLKGS